MDFIEFKNFFFKLGCFSINQIYAWQLEFDRNNLTRWLKKGYLIHLRQGYYTFPEYQKNVDYLYYFANKIYKPSYISLQTALSFYGIIPESVVNITSVTTLKTAAFQNDFSNYAYKSIKANHYFGFTARQIVDEKTVLLATPEKAIVDFLYFYPFYRTEQDFLDLRFDEDFMSQELQHDAIKEICDSFQSKALDNRLKILLKVHHL
ncbi:MAG TPA: hypothetical protein PLD62_08980 [Candidatus Cloacimonadota bacterium]|nr:hypothetical protein [Candidatus Cloacimonadota bacterium]